MGVREYTKAILGVVGTVLAALVPILSIGNGITAEQWINVAILAAGACSVFTASNVPGARYTKVALAAVTAALTAAVSVISGGITSAEWIQIVLAVFTVLGVGSMANVRADGTNLSDLGSLNGGRLTPVDVDGKDTP